MDAGHQPSDRQNDCPFCGSASAEPILFDCVRCRSCGLRYSPAFVRGGQPARSGETRTAVWMDSQARLNEERLNEIESVLGRKGRLLDVGCGFGFFLKQAAERGWNAEGTEIYEPAIRQARDEYHLQIHTGSLSELNLAPESYDAVTLWNVLDVLPDPLGDMQIMRRVLKPGGWIWIRVNNDLFHYPAYRLGRTRFLARLELKPGVLHSLGVTPRALRGFLNRCGFDEVRLRNAPLTAGDPSQTGGKLGAGFVALAKKNLSTFWQALAVLSGGKILLGSTLLCRARKPDAKPAYSLVSKF